MTYVTASDTVAVVSYHSFLNISLLLEYILFVLKRNKNAFNLQNSGISTAGTNRSSRSPTPASDICNIDKQRISLPPTLYQGMPYVLQGIVF